MIKDVVIKSLKWHRDNRGSVMEILRNDEAIFCGFGQVHVTTIVPGAVKAWHYHLKQEELFVVLSGGIRMMLYDAREDSPTRGSVDEYILTSAGPLALQVPRGVFHGFECAAAAESMVLNVPSLPYDRSQPDEVRLDPFDPSIPVQWRTAKPS
ncbi:MAG: dTDP-4-dehydrorhamnose 3,5-epimerase family protein [Lentisphaerota bacterium]